MKVYICRKTEKHDEVIIEAESVEEVLSTLNEKVKDLDFKMDSCVITYDIFEEPK